MRVWTTFGKLAAVVALLGAAAPGARAAELRLASGFGDPHSSSRALATVILESCDSYLASGAFVTAVEDGVVAADFRTVFVHAMHKAAANKELPALRVRGWVRASARKRTRGGM